jgi:hypothetical protein
MFLKIFRRLMRRSVPAPVQEPVRAPAKVPYRDPLLEDLDRSLTSMRAQGLVAVRMTVNVNRHTTTRDILLVTANVLRILREDRQPIMSFRPSRS